MKLINHLFVVQFYVVLSFYNPATLYAQPLVTDVINCNIKGEVPEYILYELDSIRLTRDQLTFLLKQIQFFRHANPNLAFLLAKKGETISKGRGFKIERGKMLYWQSLICSHLMNTASNQNYQSLEWAKMSADIYEWRGDNMGIAKTYNLVAQLYYYLSNWEKATEFNTLAEKMIVKEISNEESSRVLGDIFRIKGNILFKSKENAPGEDKLKEITDLYTESKSFYSKAKDKFGLGLINEGLGIINTSYNGASIEEIVNYYMTAIQNFKFLQDEIALSSTYLELATFYTTLYKKNNDTTWFHKSNYYLKLFTGTNLGNRCEGFFQLGSNHQTKAARLLRSGDTNYRLPLDSASYYYKAGLGLAAVEVNQTGLGLLAKGVSSICPHIDTNECTGLIRLVDSTYQKVLSANKLIRDQVKEESEIFQSELKKSQQRQITITYTLILLLSLIVFGTLYARQRWRNVKTTLDMRMKALRARMNPHFISNCLNAIDSLVNQERNDEASKYLINFDRLCRQILDKSNEELITLREEVETLENFISLEKLRLEENLHSSIEIDPQVNQEECYVPSLLLQPFVENAIWHGIQKKQAPGTLKVSVKKKESFLECIVEDDGIGRVRAQQMEEDSILNRQSWGLSISKERIDALKNISGSVLDIIDLYDKNGKAAGTRVFILLPILTKKQPNDQSNHS